MTAWSLHWYIHLGRYAQHLKFSRHVSDYQLSVSRDKCTHTWLRLHASSDSMQARLPGDTTRRCGVRLRRPPGPPYRGPSRLRPSSQTPAYHSREQADLLQQHMPSAQEEFVAPSRLLSHTWLALQHTRRSAPEINSGLPLSRAGRLPSQRPTTDNHPLETLTPERDPAYHL